MTVQDLINKLAQFDKNAKVEISAIYDSGYRLAGGDIQTIDFKNGIVFLTNDEDL